MARNTLLQALRSTRANLNTQASASNIKPGEPYLITDENRLAIGLTTSTYEAMAKQSEVIAVVPSGTRMLFVQTAAPTGWVKDTAHNDKALRVVSGTASSGGTSSFSSTFTLRAQSGSSGSTALSTNQLAVHGHTIATRFADGGVNADGSAYAKIATTGNTYLEKSTYVTGGNEGHNHSIVVNNLDLRVQYLDCIHAIKS